MGWASTELAGNPVILRCVGEQIQNLALLRDLCLVGRLFNAEFSPFLYRHVRVVNGHGLQTLGSPSQLHYTRSISFSEKMVGKEANDAFIKLLPLMPNLESFSWIRVPLASATLQSLKELPIKALHIEYQENMTWHILGLAIAPEPDEDNTVSLMNRGLYRTQDFTAYAGLEELTVHDIFDDIPAWRCQLATVLNKSPRLRKLSLSIAVDSVARASNHGRTDDFRDFFDRLCDEYADMGGEPLSLQALHCGTAAFPSSEESLQRLVDLSVLEELHIRNEDVAGDSVYLELYDEDGESGIPFAFLFSQCPKLRSFTASEVQTDVWEALCGMEPGLAQQLALSFRTQDGWDHELAHLLREDEDFPNLPMALRMTELELSRDADSETSASEILEALVESNAETLEGLCVHLPPLYEDQISGEKMDALKEALPRLVKLTQLVVQFSGQTTVDLGMALAKELSEASPRLQYIKVNKFAWQIAHAVGHDVDRENTCIHQLDQREQDHVELFSNTIFRPDPF